MRNLVADYNFLENKMLDNWDELLIGEGGSYWNYESFVEMTVPNQYDKVIRQTKLYFPQKTNQYKKCLFTVILNSSNIGGFISRIGNFDDHNNKTVSNNDFGGSGVFFEYKNNELYIGIRYGIENNGTDILINQNDFNSMILQNDDSLVINGTKIHTFEISFNTIGEIEWSIYNEGERVVLHKIRDITYILNTLPSYNLPLRLEIEKLDDTEDVGIMKQYNTNIYYEYDFTIETLDKYYIKNLDIISNIAFNINSSEYVPLFSIRLKDTNIRNHILLYELAFLISQSGLFSYAIIINPTFNNNQPSWVDAGESYKIEYDITAKSVDTNNLNIINEQYINASSSYLYNQDTNLTLNKFLPIASDINGNSDIITIVARKVGPKFVTSYFNFKWV